MTPMIDVVFLLLIFFIWTASFKVAEELMPGTFAAKRPTAGTADATPEPVPAETEVVVLQLQTQPEQVQLILNGRRIESWDEVRATFLQVLAIDSATPMVIDPELTVPYGDAIFALDLARTVGMQKVHFAVPE